MEALLWILGAVALVLLALILYPRQRQKIVERAVEHPEVDKVTPTTVERREPQPLLSPIPQAPEEAETSWLVMDFQTTGLSTVPGNEARILEATWLILDAEFREISRHTCRVRQSIKSDPEALEIHGITDTLHSPYSISESELLQRLMADLKPGVTLVSHNMEYDMAILMATFRRAAREYMEEIAQYPTLCTMTYLVTGEQQSYPSLVHLTQQLTGLTPQQFYTLHPISWRHCYFTRLCLIALLSQP